MKVRISITISKKVLEAVDQRYKNRSAYIETLVRRNLREQRKRERDAHDTAIYAKYADELNREALDSLEYQTEP